MARMIGSLDGTIRGIIRNSLIIDVNGVGYRVAVSVPTLTGAKEGAKLFLWTHLAVRENSQDLYGFETRDELSWFELLLTVSGIGPKSAQNIMNSADIQTLEAAIGRNDPSGLSKSSGIGKKTAEKIVLELRGKVGASEITHTTGGDADVVDALVGLGYSVREARDVVHALPAGHATTEERIRAAIRLASHTR